MVSFFLVFRSVLCNFVSVLVLGIVVRNRLFGFSVWCVWMKRLGVLFVRCVESGEMIRLIFFGVRESCLSGVSLSLFESGLK